MVRHFWLVLFAVGCSTAEPPTDPKPVVEIRDDDDVANEHFGRAQDAISEIMHEADARNISVASAFLSLNDELDRRTKTDGFLSACIWYDQQTQLPFEDFAAARWSD